MATFPVCVVLGVLSMLLLTSWNLKRTGNRIEEENFIFPKIVASGVIGFLTSGLFDSIVKLPIYGGFQITGITFYGGFLGAVISLLVLLVITRNKTARTVKEWFDLLTLPFICFHIFGRIGCFLGGCCYGKITNSFLGVVFPDNIAQGIIHNGVKRYPTQLFEAAALTVIFFSIRKTRHKFTNYLILYGVTRFILEFFRGDERGFISGIFSPSQIVALVLVIIATIYKLAERNASQHQQAAPIFHR